jgi:hypothetical protein
MLARFLASHEAAITGQPQTIDGRTAVEVTPTSGDGPQFVVWMNPTTYEALTFQITPTAPVQVLRWLPASRALLDNVTLNVPKRYKEATSSCAESLNPLPPGSADGGSANRCRL